VDTTIRGHEQIDNPYEVISETAGGEVADAAKCQVSRLTATSRPLPACGVCWRRHTVEESEGRPINEKARCSDPLARRF